LLRKLQKVNLSLISEKKISLSTKQTTKKNDCKYKVETETHMIKFDVKAKPKFHCEKLFVQKISDDDNNENRMGSKIYIFWMSLLKWQCFYFISTFYFVFSTVKKKTNPTKLRSKSEQSWISLSKSQLNTLSENNFKFRKFITFDVNRFVLY
jgi:hypothetical protein